MSALHRSWLADQADEARRTIVAPEMRPVGQVPCVPTSTGVLIGCAYRRPMPQPSADAERIQAALLAKPARRASDGWAFWLTLLACVLVFVLGAWLMPGPSDADAAADTAADLRDAQQQASAEWRAELKHAQALALLASRIHK